MLHGDLTSKCFEVSNELGVGYVESVYEKALLVALRQKGIEAVAQVPLKVKFRGVIVGNFVADLIVEDVVIIELKAVENLSNVHFAQLLNYLKSTGMQVGMAINFGNTKLQYRRFENRFDKKLNMTEALQDLLKD